MDMQNVSNLEIPEGEVRTIHDKDNRLLWGRVHYDTKYAGDTYQQTYSGVQLLNIFDLSSSGNVTVDSDGWMTCTIDNSSGTSDKYGTYFTNNLAALQTNTTYAIVMEVKSVSGSGTVYPAQGSSTTSQFTSNIPVSFNNVSGGGIYVYTQKTKTSFSSATYGLRTALAFAPGQSGSITFRLSVLTDTSITPETFVYQPYTGGIASPNPDYPQDVQVVTGEQTVTVSDGNQSQSYEANLGKNLFTFGSGTGTFQGIIWTRDGDTAVGSGQATANYTDTGTQIDLPVPLKANQEYVFSIPSAVNYSYNLYLFDKDGNVVSPAAKISVGQTSVTFTKNVDIYKARITLSNFGGIGTQLDLTLRAQVELGSTATTYAPYFTPIELCKIGTYQDYIYKSGDDWYVHKEIEKTTYVGDNSEDWKTTISGSNRLFYIANSATHGGGTSTPMLSNRFIYDGTANKENHIYINTYNSIVIINPTSNGELVATTTSGFKTWLSSYTLNVYYPLATPTDTKITNNTLIGQLNAVHEWLTRYGYNATVSGNLPIIIDRTNL